MDIYNVCEPVDIVEPILGISTQSNCPNKKEEVGYTLN